jgi:hypothetical protein
MSKTFEECTEIFHCIFKCFSGPYYKFEEAWNEAVRVKCSDHEIMELIKKLVNLRVEKQFNLSKRDKYIEKVVIYGIISTGYNCHGNCGENRNETFPYWSSSPNWGKGDSIEWSDCYVL